MSGGGPWRFRLLTTGLLLVLQVSSGCTNSRAARGADELHVFAASSLTEAFGEMEERFEAERPGVDVKTAFAGSQVLRLQIEHGARADLFASANASHLRALVDAGFATDAMAFGHNQLVVIVPSDNPAGLKAFTDLRRAQRLVIGTDNVPVGIYTRQVLNRAGAALGEDFAAQVRRAIVSEESNVRLIRAKVELGEADAAIVYRTDAFASTRVRVIEVPSELNARATYAIGLIADSPRAELAQRFAEFVLSEQGQRILTDHGFEAVEP